MDSATEKRLGTESIPKLLFSLGLPAVAAQIINVLYNIVDRIYIGNIPETGDIALTGVGVTLPIIMVISAFSAFVGMGGAPLASIRMGARDMDGAEKILGNCFVSLLSLSAVLTAVFLIFKEPILYAFGASDNSIPYALDYLTIYLCGTVFVQISLGLNVFISAQGHAKTAMLSVLIGAVLNICLDPVFIFGFDMGVKGAALATIISQAVSAAWVLRFLLSNKSSLRIQKKYFKPDFRLLGRIAALGMSPFIMQATESLVSITLNSGLQKYGGDMYVGAMTIIMSVLQLIVMPTQGFTQGAQPIMSYSYGAGDYKRVRQTSKLVMIILVSCSTVLSAVAIIFPQIFTRMFTSNEELIALTSKMMPVFLSGIWIFGAQNAAQAMFLALGQAKVSIFLALLRKIILLIPLALILPRFFGVNGIFFSEPIADIVSACTAIMLFFIYRKKLLPLTSDK